VLLYQALTDLHPFDPELPDKELVAAIATVPATAPHLLNPRVPCSLSDIALKLLEKRPEARYPDTAALLQALEKAAEQGRNSPAWKVPLTEPDLSALEASKEEAADHRETAPEAQAAKPPESAPSREAAQQQEAPPPARSTRRGGWLIAGFIALLLLGALGVLFGRATLAPSPTAERGASAATPRGNPTMPQSTTSQDSATSRRSSSLSSLLAASLCAATTLGCPAAQVRPEPEDCATETTDLMFNELKLTTSSPLRALVDVHQPGRKGEWGLYKEGPVVGRVTVGEGLMVEGSLLYGYLWIGPGLKDDFGREAVIGRYTQTLLPDGRKYPVCIALGGPDGRMPRMPGPQAGTVQLPRDSPVNAIWRWP
jgi:serine/threonine-protein kinase